MSIRKHKYNFYIVGIGASAGGLEALERFFSNVPVSDGMSFVVIQHLDPNRKGMMPELLQKHTPLKVTEVKDGIPVRPGHIYIIPPHRNLSLLNGKLRTMEQVESRGMNLPVDIFFKSLAAELDEKSIGVILSGMGSDGSLGIKAIKEKNGIVAVQYPGDAKFNGMPGSAMDSVVPDIVGSAEELPEKLIHFLKITSLGKANVELDDNDRNHLDKIILLIREHTGHDFSQYKRTTLYRRVERRISIHQLGKIQSYVRFLQENPSEIEILFKELLIGVTNFFRDSSVWQILSDKVMPPLIARFPDNYMIRIWVPGCSTGEEAYSWAITCREAVEMSGRKISVQIFASDMDRNAIEYARQGHYLKNIETDVSDERLNKFFTTDGNGYRIRDFIREMVVFAVHNIIKDPPFTKLDIVSCRNLLIYMQPGLQKQIISLFQYSLRPGGLLMLGTSETAGPGTFTELDTRSRIYIHSAKPGSKMIIEFSEPVAQRELMNDIKKDITEKDDNIQSIIDRIVVRNYSPPCILINESGDILYTTGPTGKYLEPSVGKANWNIHAMARDGLRQEIPSALRKAKSGKAPVIIKNIRINEHASPGRINLIVQKLENPAQVRGMILVIISDVPSGPVEAAKPLKSARGSKSSLREEELEHELRRNFEDMQTMNEEMQASQEELKATNEELQSTNEELQSTNEELTTSKEEMQSMNEELQTVNSELQNKVLEYVQAENDMKNLLNSTEIATLFLDKQLNIRRYTDAVRNIFKIRKTDIGRPLTELASDLQYPDIEKHAQNVLDSLKSIVNPITTKDDRWFNVRIMPYRSMDDRIDGLVITFIDISESKKLEIELQKKGDDLMKEKSN